MKIKLDYDEFGKSRVKMFSNGICRASISEQAFVEVWGLEELKKLKRVVGQEIKIEGQK